MSITETSPLDKRTLYEELARSLVEQIEAGTFRGGDRLPSVRQIRSQTGLSFTTIGATV